MHFERMMTDILVSQKKKRVLLTRENFVWIAL